jgi:hypothetical protein
MQQQSGQHRQRELQRRQEKKQALAMRTQMASEGDM